jgi:pre-mRNA-splicing factor 38B
MLLSYLGGVKTPSIAFSLLLRLLTMRSTTNQMELMLSHADSPYIRATGFLYLRYTCEPERLFKWFQPYLYDEEPIQVTAGKKGASRNQCQAETIGTFVRSLLSSTKRDYYGTMLPRLRQLMKMRITPCNGIKLKWTVSFCEEKMATC